MIEIVKGKKRKGNRAEVYGRKGRKEGGTKQRHNYTYQIIKKEVHEHSGRKMNTMWVGIESCTGKK